MKKFIIFSPILLGLFSFQIRLLSFLIIPLFLFFAVRATWCGLYPVQGQPNAQVNAIRRALFCCTFFFTWNIEYYFRMWIIENNLDEVIGFANDFKLTHGYYPRTSQDFMSGNLKNFTFDSPGYNVHTVYIHCSLCGGAWFDPGVNTIDYRVEGLFYFRQYDFDKGFWTYYVPSL